MPEMADAGEDHRHVTLVRGGDDFLIANRSARLNRAGGAGVSRRDEPVRKWKKRVARDRGAIQGKARLVRFPNRDA